MVLSGKVGGEEKEEGKREREREYYHFMYTILLFIQLSQCVMTHNMANYLQIEEDSDAKGTYMYRGVELQTNHYIIDNNITIMMEAMPLHCHVCM